jgi:hypothetical protein
MMVVMMMMVVVVIMMKAMIMMMTMKLILLTGTMKHNRIGRELSCLVSVDLCFMTVQSICGDTTLQHILFSLRLSSQ